MKIECDELVLRDADGHVRAELFVNDEGLAIFRMLDGFGNPRLSLSVGEGGQCMVAGEHANRRNGFGLSINEKGEPTFQVRSSDDGRAGFVLTVPNDDKVSAGLIDRRGGMKMVFPLMPTCYLSRKKLVSRSGRWA